jgi:hypothetical protein
MTVLRGASLSDVGIDAAALKPTEVDVTRATELGVETVTIDYEGPEHVPDPATLRDLAAAVDLRLTVPVRAEGFDPLGDQSRREALPAGVSEVLVAGHSAYLSETEQRRAVAPRLEAAAADVADPWVGTEGVERVALAVGGTQFELLSETTLRDVRALRAAGCEEPIAVYAPTVLTDDEDAILDAVGAYAARRQRVAEALPAGAPTDSSATGEAREVLARASREYALAGDRETVAQRVETLHDAGVDHIVGYPARGLDT